MSILCAQEVKNQHHLGFRRTYGLWDRKSFNIKLQTFHHFVELEHSGLPEGNLTKSAHSDSHTCAVIQIRTLHVKKEEIKLENIRFSRRRSQNAKRRIIDVMRIL